MDEIILRMNIEGSKTGGQIPDVGHQAYEAKKLIEAGIADGKLSNKLKVIGYEIRSVDPMEPANPRSK